MKKLTMYILASLFSTVAIAGSIGDVNARSQQDYTPITGVEIMPLRNGKFDVLIHKSGTPNRHVISTNVPENSKPVEFNYADASALKSDLMKANVYLVCQFRDVSGYGSGCGMARILSSPTQLY